MNKLLIGRGLFTLNAIGDAIGGFVADWNATHIFNDRWPPHAKFHDAQTMSFGVFLAASSLFFAWRGSGDRKTNILAAAALGGAVYVSQACAFLFPGVAWTDPEFLDRGQSLSQFPPQLYIDIVALSLVALASWLAWPSKAKMAPQGSV